MRARLILGLLVVITLVTFVSLLRRARKSPTPARLSAVFIGITTAPAPSFRQTVVGMHPGRHAVFGITNLDANGLQRFGLHGYETQSQEGWRPYVTKVETRILGELWGPGYGWVFALPWPQGLADGIPWRPRFEVSREPDPWQKAVNRTLGRTIFVQGRPHTVPGEAVDVSHLLSLETVARATNQNSLRLKLP